jgi:imidazolonepropionase-like amidohydrolase
VETPAQIEKALDSLQKLKVDFVKIYDSTISRDAYLEIIRQAEKRGLKTTGHMPYTVKLTEAAEQGLDASEHLYYVFKACSAKEDSITNLIQKRQHTDKPIGLFAALPLLYNTFDNATAEKLFTQLARKKVAVIPTLFVSRTIADLKQMQHTRDSLLSYIHPKIEATYQSRVNSAKRQSDEATQFLKKFNTKCNSLIVPMYRAGVQIIAGSDCGAFNSFVYPGSSLHEELKLLVAAGLTPAQALSTATINGAKFMGLDTFYGSIKAGKSSDLVILDSNPLADINAIGRINAIHSKSKFHTKKELDGLLKSIKR